MEKTVVVVCGNGLSVFPSGEKVTIDLSASSLESVLEYCRVVFDLFPDQYQVCVAAADGVKCQPINTWRDEDQELTKVQVGFQKFGPPQFHPSSNHPRSHMTSVLQGLQFGMRCLAQLTATQYAASVAPAAHRKQHQPNNGRIILFCTLESSADVKEIEKATLNLLHAENADIRQKRDPARLLIQKCQCVVFNTFASQATCDIKEMDQMTLSPDCVFSVCSTPASSLVLRSIGLVKKHFDLISTIITNIPMKEEQSGGGSHNYDVELIHLREGHRDIFRAGYSAAAAPMSARHEDTVVLKWSTPKSTSLDMQFCSSVYRVTPADVISRPTVCLVNFVLSGKPVLLEQPKKAPNKIISHVLTAHGNEIFLHCVPSGKSYVDDPPSISEGWGGRLTDYRIADFGQLMKDNTLVPNPVDRTKILTVHPLQKAVDNLERHTRHWPMVFNDTVVFSMAQDLEPLPSVIHLASMSDSELEACKQAIISLQSMEHNNDALHLPGSGSRLKGSKREEQYRSTWTELEEMVWSHRNNSDNHHMLFEMVSHAVSSSPSMQSARKTPQKSADIGNGEEPMDLHWKEPSREPLVKKEEWSCPPIATLPVPGQAVASLLSIWTTKHNAKASLSHPEFKGRMTHTNKAELYTALKNDSVISMADQD